MNHDFLIVFYFIYFPIYLDCFNKEKKDSVITGEHFVWRFVL